MNSPLTVTAQAVAKKPGIDAVAIARREKENIGAAFAGIAKEQYVPDWMGAEARRKTKDLLFRNTNGIGRTDVTLFDDAPPIIIAPTFARVALKSIETYEKSLVPVALEVDHSRIEYGSIEANLVALTSHHGKPALHVRERLSGQELTCILQPEVADRIGTAHSWNEIWSGKRALILGQIKFRKDGRVQNVTADDINLVEVAPIRYRDISDPDFTGGLSPSDYLESIWEEEIG